MTWLPEGDADPLLGSQRLNPSPQFTSPPALYRPPALPPYVAAPTVRQPGPMRARLRSRVAFAGVAVMLFAVVSTGYRGGLPSWVPWPDAWTASAPTGPAVAYPVFASDTVSEYLAREMIAQNHSIDVSYYAKGDDFTLIFDAMTEAFTQNPYVFVHGYRVRRDGIRVVLEPEYVYSDAVAESRRVALAGVVDSAVAELDVLAMPDVRDRVVAIHDYIVFHSRYDYDAYEAGQAGETSETSALVERGQEAYGNLVEGISVCNGYAQAFQLLARASGVESVIVTGTVPDGPTVGRHAWNRVLVDGEWLVVDVTWDDAGRAPTRRYMLIAQGSLGLEDRRADADWVLDTHLGDYEG